MVSRKGILLVILYFVVYAYAQHAPAETATEAPAVAETPAADDTGDLQTSSTGGIQPGDSADVEAGHNEVSCNALPVNNESIAQINLAGGGEVPEILQSEGLPDTLDATIGSEETRLGVTQNRGPSANGPRKAWKPEWTVMAMDCMTTYAQEFLTAHEVPDDYQEYCGGPMRSGSEAERRLLLLSVLVSTAYYESGFDPEAEADLEAIQAAGGSIGATQTSENPPTGLFQMGVGDCIEGESCDLTDPATSICMAVKKANDQIAEDEVFAGCKNSDAQTCKGDEWGGMAAYWEPHRTMTTNNAISKVNAIKNSVRGVCACGDGSTNTLAGNTSTFANVPEQWMQAAINTSTGGGMTLGGGAPPAINRYGVH